MSLRKITAIARTIDPNYPTNRAVALLTLSIIAGGGILRLMAGAHFMQSISWGGSGRSSSFPRLGSGSGTGPRPRPISICGSRTGANRSGIP